MAPGIADLHRLMGRGAAEVSAVGARVTLSDGRSTLDFGSYAVTLLGHRPSGVVHAVRDALDVMPTATRLLPNATTASFAAKLVDVIGATNLDRVVIGLNGSDAVDAALKLAIAATGRSRCIALKKAFHGKSLGALAVTFDPARRAGLEALLGHVTFIELEADAVHRALAKQPAAALIFEPVQGEGGGREIPPDVLRRWCADARAAGTGVIADEIQVGLRRCGPMSIAVDLGLDVDAILFGKPLGGGVMPLSAVLCSTNFYRPILEDPFFHTATFGGHPLACAAGLAALEALDAAGADVDRLARVLRVGVERLTAGTPAVQEASSKGVFAAIRFVSADMARTTLLEASRRGLLLAPCLTALDTLRMLPPTVTTDAELEEGLAILEAACASATVRIS